MSWDWSAELITAISTAALAFIALVVAIIEGLAVRKHNRLSVRPLLDIMRKNRYGNTRSKVHLELRNLGLGPAIVKSHIVFFDDKKFIMPEEEGKFKEQIDLAPFNAHTKKIGYESIIPSNGCYALLSVFINGSKREALAFVEHLGFKIEFKSVYKNKTFVFIISNELGYPQDQSKLNNLFASCYAGLREKIKGIWLWK